MKKILVTILAFIYLTVSCGATVQLHYCMGKLANWSIWQFTEKKCGKCGMEKATKDSKGCCKDEQKQIKFEKDQKTNETSVQVLQPVAVSILPAPVEIPANDLLSSINNNCKYHSPPRNNGISVYIRYCVFLL